MNWEKLSRKSSINIIWSFCNPLYKKHLLNLISIISEDLFKNVLSKKNKANLLEKLISTLDVVIKMLISFTVKSLKNMKKMAL